MHKIQLKLTVLLPMFAIKLYFKSERQIKKLDQNGNVFEQYFWFFFPNKVTKGF